MAGNADPWPTTQEAPLGFSSPVMSSRLHDELRFPRVFLQSPHLLVVSPPGSSQRVLPGVSFLLLHQQDGTSRPQSGVGEVRHGRLEAGAGSGQFTFIYFFF